MAQATDKQAELFWVIKDFLAEVGYPPTRREMAKRLGLSKTAVDLRLRDLATKGFVRCDFGSPRGVVLLREPSRGHAISGGETNAG